MKNFRINLAILIGILILGVFVSFPIVSVNNPSNPVEEIKLSDGEITIVTPENKTYTGSMSGFYPGTYGFENDKIGEEPEDWLLFPGDPAMSTEILSELDGHKMVLDMNKGNTYGDNYNLYQYFSEPQVYGAIELWMRTTDALEGSHYHLQNDTTAVWGFGISDNTFNYFEPGVWNPVAFSALSNVWYHIRVEFECGSGNHYGLAEDTWRMFINGVQFGDYNFSIAQTSMKNLRISQNWRYDNYHIYTDAIGYSWNQNYNLGDNLNEGLLLSYDNTTSLIWQGFSIDGLSNKTILGNSTIPLPNDGIHSIQVFGNDSVGTMYESNMRYFTVNTTPYINIITPENKAYTEPMSGFYPATYGFENEMDGTSGTDIDFVDYAGIIADTSISITSEEDGHKKVIYMRDDSTSSGGPVIEHNLMNAPTTNGTIEWWFRTEDLTGQWSWRNYENGNYGYYILTTGTHFAYYDGGGSPVLHNIVEVSVDIWYHIRIDFEHGDTQYEGLSADTFFIWIKEEGGVDVRYGPYDFRYGSTQTNHVQFAGSSAGTGYGQYIDAWGESGDPEYNLGDNLNEGLLLSYDSNIDFDWQGYSLDGLSNRTILGNNTVALPNDGVHTIQVFGNDSLGTIFESTVQQFTVDRTPPQISITYPTAAQEFSDAPAYILSITEENVESMWYTLNGGTTHPFSSETGTIDTSAWDVLANGPVTIRFYVRDVADREAFEEVIVVKIASDFPTPPGISGYNIITLIGVIGVATLIIMKKKNK